MSNRSSLDRRLIAGALLLALSGLTACGNSSTESAALAAGSPGEEVHGAGETDVVVLDSASVTIAGIQTDIVQTVETTGLLVTGTIIYDANRVSQIGPRTEGRIVTLQGDLGERVRTGQTLAILESVEVGRTRAEEHEAEALRRIARENYERERELEAQGISSRKELLQAEAELRRAEAALQSAQERLRVLGAGHGTGGQFAVTAPFAGVIVAREASRGEITSPADRLFTVADLSRVWIELNIFERDLARVAVNQSVEVVTAAYPGRTFPGRIVYLGDILDPQSRTVRARVEIPNADGVLKPGMFATATIQVGGGSRQMVVPQGAVQEVNGRKVVFVPGDEPGEFRAQPVEIGEIADNGRVIVRSGLDAGDRIVVAGAFALRSELAKGEIREHGH